jgi:hypothetical protein
MQKITIIFIQLWANIFKVTQAVEIMGFVHFFKIWMGLQIGRHWHFEAKC